MRLLGRTALVGAYVCPGGVFAVELVRGRGGYTVARTFESAVPLDNPQEAASELVNALASAGCRRADVAITIRGFGVAHHILQLPPATDDILSPVVDREMRRLEPHIVDAAISWISLPSMRAVGPEAPDQRSVLAVAAPRQLASAFTEALRDAGSRLMHLTALPVAMQRLVEEFEGNAEAAGLVSPLPDGAFLGFALDGALRIVIEPHLPQDAEHELPALAEESQLGVVFVRQQFRGAHIDHLSLVGSKHSMRDAETVLSERVGVPVTRYDIRDLTPAGYAALGGVLDARSPAPLSLGGASRDQVRTRSTSALENASWAAVAVVVLLAGLTAVQAFRSRDAAVALREAQARVARDSIALAPIRAVAAQRRGASDAVQAMQLAARERIDLQRSLVGIASAVRPPVELDSLLLAPASDGWRVLLGGRASAETSARAVQWLHDLYREIPRRLRVDSVKLDQLTYDEAAAPGASGDATVRFQLSFVVPPRRTD